MRETVVDGLPRPWGLTAPAENRSSTSAVAPDWASKAAISAETALRWLRVNFRFS